MSSLAVCKRVAFTAIRGARWGSARYHFTSAARGAIAQLGEHLHGMQGVGGSNPPGSTN